MEFHFDRKIVLRKVDRLKNLYDWCIQEVDEAGAASGRDLIPWRYNSWFLAIKTTLVEEVERDRTDEAAKEAAIFRRYIYAEIEPQKDRQALHRTIRYSMLGTDRDVRKFSLIIRPAAEEEQEHEFYAWGAVAYTYELDFRNNKTDDCVSFHISMEQRSFEALAAHLANRTPTRIVVRVGKVDGFYSDWSPSISTDLIKILTPGREHAVEPSSIDDVVPPRLGKILDLSIRFEVENSHELKDLEDTDSSQVAPDREDDLSVQDTRPAIEPASQLPSLASIQAGLWAIVALLLLILIFK